MRGLQLLVAGAAGFFQPGLPPAAHRAPQPALPPPLASPAPPAVFVAPATADRAAPAVLLADHAVIFRLHESIAAEKAAFY